MYLSSAGMLESAKEYSVVDSHLSAAPNTPRYRSRHQRTLVAVAPRVMLSRARRLDDGDTLMTAYVDLGRRFVYYEKRDISTLTLRLLGDLSPRVTVGWDDLLRSRCVVILGEPGSGKTEESKAKVGALRREGKYAFYRPVSGLCRGSPLVTSREITALDAWRRSDAECLFVLDALDEARNAGDALYEAVDRVAGELEPHWERVRLVLTCRVAEWRMDEDRAALSSYFPPSDRDLRTPRDDELASPVDPPSSVHRRVRAEVAERPPDVRVVRLVGLSEKQAIDFATALGAKEPERLGVEVQRTGAWTLMERPADVDWLVASWNRRGTIGTLTALMQDNVAARLAETSSPRRRTSRLAADRAEKAAGEISLCAILTGEHRVRTASLARGTDADALDPAALLPWMQASELVELTERAIFADDGPNVRRVHHRSTEEFLAAAALRNAFGGSPGSVAITRFLVREMYGCRVVPPSWRGVAGWAGGSDEVLRRALLDADPLVLLEAGDPSQIPPGERRGVLSRVLADLDARPWRREEADDVSVARFACSELGDVIRARLEGGPGRGLVLCLRLVRLGRIAEGTSAALRIAARGGEDTGVRGLAARAAAAAGDEVVRDRLVRLVLNGRSPRIELLPEVADELYPAVLPAGRLAAGLVAWARTGGVGQSGLHTWTWLLDREYEPGRHQELAAVLGEELLRAALAIPERRSGVGDGLVRLAVLLRSILARRLRDGVPADDVLERWAPWLWAIARVHEAGAGHHDLYRGVSEFLDHREIRVHVLRWLVRNRASKSEGEPTSPFSAFRGEPHDLWRPRGGDTAVLSAEIPPARDVNERLLWLGLAEQAATEDNDLGLLEGVTSRFSELSGKLARLRAKRVAPPHPWQQKFEREEREREAQREAQREKNRRDLLALVGRIREGTHDGALRFLTEHIEDREHSRWGLSNWGSLAVQFGEEIAEAARDGLKAAWRRFKPLLPHEREKPNSVEWFVPVGLTGLNLAFTDLDPSDLSHEDVERAAAFALCEINAFPVWFGSLAEARPGPVLSLLERVLEAEYAGRGASSERYVLDNLGYRDVRVRRLATPALLRLLEEHVPAAPKALERALAALVPSAGDRSRLVAIARGRATLSGSETGAAWWRCLADLDAHAAASILHEAVRSGEAPERLLVAVAAVDWRSSGLSAGSLAEIVRSTYRVVVPVEDVEHPSGEAYAVGTRDEAEQRRAALVTHLADLPGEATFRALLDLASDPAVAAHRVWFERLAHERAQRDAERHPMSVGEARAFIERRGEFTTPEGFFEYTLERLDDLREGLENGDFSCRALLRQSDEAGAQLFVAHTLRLATNGRCSVVREEEVDREKKPDIRLHTTVPGALVGIEVKVADNWSARELVAALETQLVGQYLRDLRSRYGVLLLVHTGKKPRWGRGAAALTFRELAARLTARAVEISRSRGVQTRVVAIDCSSP